MHLLRSLSPLVLSSGSVELSNVLFDELAEFDHALSLTEPEGDVHDLECDEEWRQERVGEVCLQCWGPPFKHGMADELGDPAESIDEAHEPKFRHPEVGLLPLCHPGGVPKDHCGPIPRCDG